MSASARAEARRKAILSKGSDRLAKLTTSARGEDAPAYMSETASTTGSTTRNFLGDESMDMPAPSTSFSPSPSPSPQPSVTAKRAVSAGNGHPVRPSASNASASTTRSSSSSAAANQHFTNRFEGAGLGSIPTPDPTVWTPEQQQQFMRALMGASANTSSTGVGAGQTPLQSPLGDPNAPLDHSLPPLDNPLAAMLFNSQAGGGQMPPGFQQQPQQVKPPSKLQKYLPLVHLLLLWALLAYFVLWFEPKEYEKNVVDSFPDVGFWGRWRELVRSGSLAETGLKRLQVQITPFFWAFITLEVMLHSIQIFTGSNKVQPPSLVAMFLPQLPPPIPSIVTNSLKYFRMFSMFLDDVAGIIVGLGFIIYFAGFLS